MSPHRHLLSRRWSRSIKFWLVAVLLCVMAAFAALGVKRLLLSVGESRHTRYEPVDVPPVEVSPRHEREREELERREKAMRITPP